MKSFLSWRSTRYHQVMNRYCLIGHPVSHSISPQIHNAWFREHGMDAHYELQDIFPHELPAFLERLRREYAGANITIPYKEEVMQYLDHIDETAEEIGAVNTIINTHGILSGFNTDWIGALQALAGAVTGTREGWEQEFLRGKRVMILGTGGAAKAVAYGVDRARGSLVFVTRQRSHAQNLADFYDAELMEYDELFDNAPPDIIINTTPVGMHPDEGASPLPSEFWYGIAEKKPGIAIDIVSNPPETQFLSDAAHAGWKTVNGEKMLKYQAGEAFEIWTGVRPI